MVRNYFEIASIDIIGPGEYIRPLEYQLSSFAAFGARHSQHNSGGGQQVATSPPQELDGGSRRAPYIYCCI
jgi:hypothetical protein